MARFTSDAMEVITDPNVDAVWICSPSQYHAEQIKACAANGKHVFCEKPIATDLPETVEAINACNEAGVKLMIGLQRRFDQNFLRVKNAIINKEVGESIMVRQNSNFVCVCVCVRASHAKFIIIQMSPFIEPNHSICRSNCALVIPPHLPSSMFKVEEEFSLTWQFTIWT